MTDQIDDLKNKVESLEYLHEPIGLAIAQVYCVDCGHYKPFSTLSKCSKCGGEMTDKQKEEIKKSLDLHLKKAKATIQKIKKRVKTE